ncbi:MAG: protein kinase [Polyangia bacterium]
MAPDICPRCGKPAHGPNFDFECPALITSPGAAPAVVTPTPPAARATGSFRVTDGSSITRLQPGTLVGEYQILDRIAEGGMGTVYSAVHPIIGKKVAIKVLSGRLAKNNNAIRRFVLEARAVNDIRHPALVDIFSFGRLTDGRPYYVMEFLDGRSLGAVLRTHRRLAPFDTYPVFMDVGRVLVAVHDHGIIHRDLKPDNVILIPQGVDRPPKVKLVDFGLAKLLLVTGSQTSSGPHTAIGVNVGTPHYMAPEQCRGGNVDARSDLYALGVMFYETVTGLLPIDGPTPVDIWQAHVEVVPRPPDQVAPRVVSAELSALIMRLLAKRPERRPQNAAEFCDALEALAKADKLGVHATPPPDDQPDAGMLDLARALSTTPVSSELVALDGARAGAPDTPPAGVGVGLGPPLIARKEAPQPVGRAPQLQNPVAIAEDLSSTLRDVPIIELPEQRQRSAERLQEVEGLRAALGLRIEEPGDDPGQASALVVNLEAGASETEAPASATGNKDRASGGPSQEGSLRARRLVRPVEERQYVPRLAAPTRRPAKPSSVPPNLAKSRSRFGRVIVGVAVALAAAGAAAAAYWFLR